MGKRCLGHPITRGIGRYVWIAMFGDSDHYNLLNEDSVVKTKGTRIEVEVPFRRWVVRSGIIRPIDRSESWSGLAILPVAHIIKVRWIRPDVTTSRFRWIADITRRTPPECPITGILWYHFNAWSICGHRTHQSVSNCHCGDITRWTSYSFCHRRLSDCCREDAC